MALTIKSRADLIQDLVTAIKARDTAVETGYGPAKDLVVDPVSQVTRELYLQVKHVFDIEFLKNADLMDTAELDLLGESLGVKRKGPVSAVGSVFFYTSSQPLADILIPTGTPVASRAITGSVTSQSYVTSRTTTIFAASSDTFFNASVGLFEFEVPIRAVLTGASTNTAAGTIKTLMRQFSGISGVVNKSPTRGGRDIETNSDYARRISLALSGTARGTVGGLRRFGLEDERVIDAVVIQSGDPLLKRAEVTAGAIDVYILGEEPTVTQQMEKFTGLDIFFDNEPLVFPTPVSKVTAATGAMNFTERTHFFIDRDVILEGSAKARTIFRWNRSRSDLPDAGDTVTIEYTYDKLIQDLQVAMADPENSLLADVLFRSSEEEDISLTATVKASHDVIDLNAFKVAIQGAVTDFVNSRGLGVPIHESDLDLVIRSVPGVDFVFLPFAVLAKVGKRGSGTIPIEKNQFAQISDTSITINTSL